jgi:hypothetical protein
MIREIRRRIRLAEALRQASQGRRREVAVYRDYSVAEPLASGTLTSIGWRGVWVGVERVPWGEIERAEAWPDARCQNCLREHGPLEACFLGVIAGVLADRGTRESISPELLAGVWVDEMWDRYGGPAADWLEEHLNWLEANDAV